MVWLKTARSMQESGNYRKKAGSVTALLSASLTEQLQNAYGLAMQTGHAAAAVGATWALAKLHGLDKPAQKKQEDLFPEIVIRVVDNPEPMGNPKNPSRPLAKPVC